VSRALLSLLVAVAVAFAGGVTGSGADFTANSASPGNTFTAAADFNTVAVSLGALGSTLTGSVSVTATATSDRGIASVKFQSAPAGTTDWVDICTDTTASYDCSWTTSALADGSYDVRAVATDLAGYTRTSTITARNLDNYPLTVSLANPGANVSGTVSLSATATGASGSLTAVTIQHRAPGAPTWTDLCTSATSPATCGLDTTAYADGPRELRAVATDSSGATAIAAVRTPNLDNSPPTATPSVPSSGTGTVTMSATASDSGSGIAYVAFEALYAGTWYEFCRDTSAPFTCSGDSAAVADGTYSIRVVVVDNAGMKTIGTPSSITIDNPPVPADVQAGNGGATTGLLQAGDWVKLTWSEQIAPASVLSGWNGAGQAILVRLTDNASNDQMDFYNAAGTTRLNLTGSGADLKLGGNFVSGAVTFNATMSQSGSSITVTLGSVVGSPTLPTAVAGTMTWAPSASATDLTGHASRTTTVTESGAVDVDF
jgi:chitinase